MKEYIVVTGASSGIGQALAIQLANMGYNVLAIGRNQVGLQRTKALAVNGRIIPLIADLSTEEAFDVIAEKFNAGTNVKYLIHCAAVLEPSTPLLEANYKELTTNINTNLIAPLALTRTLTPYFTSATRVLFIGSDYEGIDKKIKPNVSGPYAISKTALRVAVKYLRCECDGTALIGYVNPGTTQTPLYARFWKAVNTKGAINNSATPAKPSAVAHFMVQVLENSDDSLFCSTDWDYRKSEQQLMIQVLENSDDSLFCSTDWDYRESEQQLQTIDPPVSRAKL